jgi:stage V sporulation protein S
MVGKEDPGQSRRTRTDEAGERAVPIVKVSSKSNPHAVAGALAGVVRQHGAVVVDVVGAGAVNQAIKAIAIARSYLQADHVDLVCIPDFTDIEISGESRTGIRLRCEDRQAIVVDLTELSVTP